MRRLLAVVAVMGVALAACSPGDAAPVDPKVTFEGERCSSSDPSNWPDGVLQIELSNNMPRPGAVIMGTYDEGFGQDDLEAYGSDISTRPPFINALEIFEVGPDTTDQFEFDHGPDLYFVVCMSVADTMTVLGDLTIGS